MPPPTPSPSPSAETIASYDLTAEAYHERWADRTVLAPELARFVALVNGLDAPAPWVVDIGCGPGYDAAALQAAGLRVIGVDLSAGMLRAGRRRYSVPLVQGDMCALPLRAGAAGLWASASLHHLPRRLVPSALASFVRVLRPGGWLFLSLRGGSGSGWQPLADDPERRRFFTYWSLEVLQPLLNGAGLTAMELLAEEEGEKAWLSLFAQRQAP